MVKGSACHASPCGPLGPNVTSSIKPEVYNVLQCHQGRTEPLPQGICTKNFVKIGPVVPELCSWTDRQTNKQTNWSQYTTPQPGRSNDVPFQLICRISYDNNSTENNKCFLSFKQTLFACRRQWCAAQVMVVVRLCWCRAYKVL